MCEKKDRGRKKKASQKAIYALTFLTLGTADVIFGDEGAFTKTAAPAPPQAPTGAFDEATAKKKTLCA